MSTELRSYLTENVKKFGGRLIQGQLSHFFLVCRRNHSLENLFGYGGIAKNGSPRTEDSAQGWRTSFPGIQKSGGPWAFIRPGRLFFGLRRGGSLFFLGAIDSLALLVRRARGPSLGCFLPITTPFAWVGTAIEPLLLDFSPSPQAS